MEGLSEAFLPTDMLARIVHWCYQSGDKPTATKLLMTHKNDELQSLCALMEQPIVFTVNPTGIYSIGLNSCTETDITVDWGDGKWNDYKGHLSQITHRYKSDNTYRIRIYARRLYGLKSLHSVISFPTIGNVITSCAEMFMYSGINTSLIWDTSKITDMSRMFYKAYLFNQPLVWDTSNTTDMHDMFYHTVSFNSPLKFDTRRCKNMQSMFCGAEKFNQCVNFDTSACTNMTMMFHDALEFNQPVKFDTYNVITMNYMFQGAVKFNQPIIFDIFNIKCFNGMFDNRVTKIKSSHIGSKLIVNALNA